jgi:hypothetical protein
MLAIAAVAVAPTPNTANSGSAQHTAHAPMSAKNVQGVRFRVGIVSSPSISDGVLASSESSVHIQANLKSRAFDEVAYDW